MTIKDTNITLHVHDMDRAVRFYQSIGFSLINRWGDYYAQLRAAGIVLGLHPSTKAPDIQRGSGNVSIGFTADNMDMVQKELQKLEIPFTTREEAGGQFIHFADPEGTVLYFINPKG